MLAGIGRVLLVLLGIGAMLAATAATLIAIMWVCLMVIRLVPLTGQWRKRWTRRR